MASSLTLIQEEQIGNLFEKYKNDWELWRWDEGDFFFNLPPEVILTVGDILNIINNGQSIDVIEPQSYDRISTLTPNSRMFEDISGRDPLGNFYMHETKTEQQLCTSDLGEMVVWHPCITAYEECKNNAKIIDTLVNGIVEFLDEETKNRQTPKDVLNLIVQYLDLCEEERIKCFRNSNIVDPYSAWAITGSGGDVWIKANKDLWTFLKEEQREQREQRERRRSKSPKRRHNK